MTTPSASSASAGLARLSGPMLLVVASLAGSVARADPSPQDRALAQSLFDRGRALMQDGKLDQACPKLAESHRLDPGGGTLLNLAKCYEMAGKVASAWATYEEALALSRRERRTDRALFCQRKLDELEPMISTLTLSVPDAVRVDGMEVKLGERLLAPAAWGSPLPLDPGEYQLTASAPGRKAWSARVRIGERADRQSIELPALEVEEPVAPPAVSSAPVAATAPASSEAPPAAVQPPAPARPAPTRPEAAGAPVLGYVVGAVGLAGLGVGSYFGLRAMSTWDDRKGECDNDSCNPRGMQLDEDTSRYANYANIGVAVGLVGLGVGSYLILSHDSGSGSPGGVGRGGGRVVAVPSVDPQHAGVHLQADW